MFTTLSHFITSDGHGPVYHSPMPMAIEKNYFIPVSRHGRPTVLVALHMLGEFHMFVAAIDNGIHTFTEILYVYGVSEIPYVCLCG